MVVLGHWSTVDGLVLVGFLVAVLFDRVKSLVLLAFLFVRLQLIALPLALVVFAVVLGMGEFSCTHTTEVVLIVAIVLFGGVFAEAAVVINVLALSILQIEFLSSGACGQPLDEVVLRRNAQVILCLVRLVGESSGYLANKWLRNDRGNRINRSGWVNRRRRINWG